MHKWLIPILVLLGACSAVVKSDLRVDDAAFPVAECRSGQIWGFSGIQFAAADGRRLRLTANADGTADAALFEPHAVVGAPLGACAVLTMRMQNSRINGIANLEGSAAFQCAASGHRLEGTLQFENCH